MKMTGISRRGANASSDDRCITFVFFWWCGAMWCSGMLARHQLVRWSSALLAFALRAFWPPPLFFDFLILCDFLSKKGFIEFPDQRIFLYALFVLRSSLGSFHTFIFKLSSSALTAKIPKSLTTFLLFFFLVPCISDRCFFYLFLC